MQKPNPGVFTVDKGKGLERGSGSSHQLLWLEASGRFSSGAEKTQGAAIRNPIGWGPRLFTPRGGLGAELGRGR